MSENRARDFSRRSFLKGTAAGAVAASLGTATSFAWMAPAAAAEPAPMPPHGAELRGMDLVVESPTTEGRFGFMFKSQPPLGRASDTLLDRLGATMEEQPAVGRPASSSAATTKTTPSTRTPTRTSRRGSPSSASSSTTTSPSTPRPSTSSSPTPTPPPTSARPATTSTPSTGGAPSADPQFYDPADRDKFLIVDADTYSTIKRLGTDPMHHGHPGDVERHGLRRAPHATRSPTTAEGKAIIADPRNDQTLIILQLHVAMQMFHNKLVDAHAQQAECRGRPCSSRLGAWPGGTTSGW